VFSVIRLVRITTQLPEPTRPDVAVDPEELAALSASSRSSSWGKIPPLPAPPSA
jgi:hypothetical protein